MTFRQFLKRIKKPTIKVTIVFLIIGALALAFLANDVLGSASYLMEVFEEAQLIFEDFIDESGNINPVTLILNNIRVCFLALGLGIIPFLYLPVIVLLINSLILGVVLGTVGAESISEMVKVFVFGIVPHGILELPAIFISIACGMLLCHTLTKGILKKNRDMKTSEVLINSLKTIIFICIPLMIVAGLIEVFITTKLLAMML